MQDVEILVVEDDPVKLKDLYRDWMKKHVGKIYVESRAHAMSTCGRGTLMYSIAIFFRRLPQEE